MKFILGKKLGMTQVFRADGTVVPVTRVKAGPCVVTQVKTKEKDGASAVQVGFGEQKAFRLNKAIQGHLKDLSTVSVMRDFSDDTDHGLKRGDTFTVSIFEPGEKVKVTGKSKGRGFQGVVKRHNFAGSPASHGHKDQLRMPGSIGATDPGRVFKGTRMGGHMGDARVTVSNLEIIEVLPEFDEILIKGAVPGARGGLLMISTPEGKIAINNEQKTNNSEELTVSSEPASATLRTGKQETTGVEDTEADAVVGEKLEVGNEEEKVEEKSSGAKAEEIKEETK